MLLGFLALDILCGKKPKEVPLLGIGHAVPVVGLARLGDGLVLGRGVGDLLGKNRTHEQGRTVGVLERDAVGGRHCRLLLSGLEARRTCRARWWSRRPERAPSGAPPA